MLSAAHREARIALAAAAFAIALGAGCGFRAGYDEIGLPCTSSSECPGGQTCLAGVCTGSDINPGPPQPDADPNAPDADPNAPDAGTAPDASLNPPGTAGCGSTFLLSDNFDDGQLHWQWRTTVDSGVSAFETEGHVAIHLTSSAGSGVGIVESSSLLDIRNAEASVLVIQIGAARTSLEFRDYADAGAAIAVENGVLHAEVVSGELRTILAVMTYDPDVQKYWRLREASGTMFWEVSKDRSTWSQVASRALPASSTWGYVSLRATGALGASSESWFDDVTPVTKSVAGFCAASSIKEPFDTAPTPRWYSWSGTASCSGRQSNGRYELTYSGSGEAWCGLQTRQLVDLRNDAAAVEVVTAPGASRFSTFLEAVSLDGNTRIELRRESDGLWIKLTKDGATRVDTNMAYDATAHRFWRIREANGIVFWEASPNGTQWNGLVSTVANVDVRAVVIDMAAGHWSPGPGSSQTARFDRYSP